MEEIPTKSNKSLQAIFLVAKHYILMVIVAILAMMIWYHIFQRNRFKNASYELRILFMVVFFIFCGDFLFFNRDIKRLGLIRYWRIGVRIAFIVLLVLTDLFYMASLLVAVDG